MKASLPEVYYFTGSQLGNRKLFSHGPHSSKNNFFEIKISQRPDWESPSLSYYGSWHWLCLCLRCLRSSENCIVGVASRSGRINQWQCSIPGFAIGWFFRFCFRLRQSSFHWIISDGDVNGIGRNGNVLILPAPIPSSLWHRLRLRFSIFTRS